MKHIPIVILNKDRLDPLILLVNSLRIRGYTNILIIDNKSTYQPLLDWYAGEEATGTIQVFHNTIHATLFDTGTFYRLAFELNVQPFCDIVKDYYVFTDSDVIPHESIPDNFIEQMVALCKQYPIHKIGLGLKIDDLPISAYTDHVINIESQYWADKVSNNEYELYKATIDTTFAIYSPNSKPIWSSNSIRMGGKFVASHMPWYYDMNNLPDDEKYYLQNLERNKGPVYSQNIKDTLTAQGVL